MNDTTSQAPEDDKTPTGHRASNPRCYCNPALLRLIATKMCQSQRPSFAVMEIEYIMNLAKAQDALQRQTQTDRKAELLAELR